MTKRKSQYRNTKRDCQRVYSLNEQDFLFVKQKSQKLVIGPIDEGVFMESMAMTFDIDTGQEFERQMVEMSGAILKNE